MEKSLEFYSLRDPSTHSLRSFARDDTVNFNCLDFARDDTRCHFDWSAAQWRNPSILSFRLERSEMEKSLEFYSLRDPSTHSLRSFARDDTVYFIIVSTHSLRSFAQNDTVIFSAS